MRIHKHMVNPCMKVELHQSRNLVANAIIRRQQFMFWNATKSSLQRSIVPFVHEFEVFHSQNCISQNSF
jgi:hypothetical protein